MAGLFFGESIDLALHDKQILAEEITPDEVVQVMGEFGIMNKLDSGGKDIQGNLEAAIGEIEAEFGPQYEAASSIRRAKNFDELGKALTAASAAGFDVGSINVSDIQAKVDADVKRLTDPNSETEVLDSLEEDEREKFLKMSPEKIGENLESSIFVAASDGIRKNIDGVAKQLQESIQDLIGPYMPETKESAEMLKQTPAGQEYINTLNTFLKKFRMSEV